MTGPLLLPPAETGAPHRPEVTVSITVPSDWKALPPAATGGHDGATELRVWLADLATRATEDGVLFCAFGTLLAPGRQPVAGAALVLGVRSATGMPPIDVVHAGLRVSDPEATLQLGALPLAGAAARLAWSAVVGPARVGVHCVEYWVPFPGDDDRVAILSACALPGRPDAATGPKLDQLAATLSFVSGHPHQTPGSPR